MAREVIDYQEWEDEIWESFHRPIESMMEGKYNALYVDFNNDIWKRAEFDAETKESMRNDPESESYTNLAELIWVADVTGHLEQGYHTGGYMWWDSDRDELLIMWDPIDED